MLSVARGSKLSDIFIVGRREVDSKIEVDCPHHRRVCGVDNVVLGGRREGGGGREGGREGGGREKGREEGRKGKREGGREEGREGRREGGKKGGREGKREGGRERKREGAQYLPEGYKLTADLPRYQPYVFPLHIATTDQRPDIVVWSDTVQEVWVIELTVCF